MKNKILSMVAVIIVLSLLCGCRLNKEVTLDTSNCYELIVIEDGGIIYVKAPYCLAPYYSPNGKLCHYIDGEIVEIE